MGMTGGSLDGGVVADASVDAALVSSRASTILF
jgi:hypothetical protein